jgi:DNA-binding LacI/PurR family transcriptional regulator
VTAIFVSGSRGALGALKALRAKGLSAPADMSVVGFLRPAWLDVSNPPLTSYALPLEQMSTMTAGLLLDRIQGRRAAGGTEPNVMRFEGRLVVRESTAPPRTHALEQAR